MAIDYKKTMMSAFGDELSQIVGSDNQPTATPPASEYPNSVSRSGRIPEHISTFLSKRAAISPEALKMGGTVGGSIAGWEVLKRMEKDRRLGRMVRRQSEQQQQGQ